ncbi:MAG: hypothetical protein Aurels2KO_49970 [Aureliella sp.]
MQLLQFRTSDGAESRPGLVSGDGVIDISQHIPHVTSLHTLYSDWDALRGSVGELSGKATDTRLADIKVDCPVQPTVKTICIGLNYRDHAIESGMEIPSEPVVFCKLPGALCAHDEQVPLPACSEQVDYEAELVIVIGKHAHCVSQADALNHIFGYSCGHDVSARDWQIGRPGGQWLLGKSFPNFAPVGPFVVPSEFVPDPGNLRVRLRLGGETLQDSTTKQLIFGPAELVSYLSQCMILEPGDVIFTGTPPGVGMARKPQRFLKDGDVAEVEIEGTGILRNSFHAS